MLDGVSFRVAPGEKVAIVGPSGAGKSTIFHLLLRFYDPTERHHHVRRRAARRRRSGASCAGASRWCRRTSPIFAASVAENIRFGRPDATDAEVERAAELALADEFIRKLPQGYDTPIGERGVTLSGGQRQRIAIARAILRAGAAAAARRGDLLARCRERAAGAAALEHLMQGRTTLVIAHRLATVLSCDRILVMDQGRIVEEGRHDSLVAQGGLYARLARLQFETG